MGYRDLPPRHGKGQHVTLAEAKRNLRDTPEYASYRSPNEHLNRTGYALSGERSYNLPSWVKFWLLGLLIASPFIVGAALAHL